LEFPRLQAVACHVLPVEDVSIAQPLIFVSEFRMEFEEPIPHMSGKFRAVYALINQLPGLPLKALVMHA
jgi:hypothetical protein